MAFTRINRHRNPKYPTVVTFYDAAIQKKRHRGVQAGRRGEEREVTHGGRSSVDSNTAETARENNTNMIRVGQVSYVRAFLRKPKNCSHNKELHTNTSAHTRHVKTHAADSQLRQEVHRALAAVLAKWHIHRCEWDTVSDNVCVCV